MAFNVIPDSAVDSGSPVTEQLMFWIRDNGNDLNSRLVTVEGSYVDNTHPHTGGANGPQIAQGGLKTATSSGSVNIPASSGGTYALTGGTWSMWTGSADGGTAISWGGGNTAAGTVGFHNSNTAGAYNAYIDERYFQASPPYQIGNAGWGHFYYVLRKIGTGEILGTSEAPDPTWAYNGALWVPDKNSPERMIEAPHPFADYWTKDPAVDGLEVVLLDMRDFDIDTMKLNAMKQKKRVSTELARLVNVGAEITLASLGLSDPALHSKLRMKIRGRI